MEVIKQNSSSEQTTNYMLIHKNYCIERRTNVPIILMTNSLKLYHLMFTSSVKRARHYLTIICQKMPLISVKNYSWTFQTKIITALAIM